MPPILTILLSCCLRALGSSIKLNLSPKEIIEGTVLVVIIAAENKLIKPKNNLESTDLNPLKRGFSTFY